MKIEIEITREKKNHGGAREGAGRKKKENARSIRVSFMLSPEADAALRRRAAEEGCSRNDAINRLLEDLD